jgi:hypothetical protein
VIEGKIKVVIVSVGFAMLCRLSRLKLRRQKGQAGLDRLFMEKAVKMQTECSFCPTRDCVKFYEGVNPINPN